MISRPVPVRAPILRAGATVVLAALVAACAGSAGTPALSVSLSVKVSVLVWPAARYWIAALLTA